MVAAADRKAMKRGATTEKKKVEKFSFVELLDDAEDEQSQLESGSREVQEDELKQIRLDQIKIREQIRDKQNATDISDIEPSIRKHGVIQPVTLAALNDGSYLMLAGERRYWASEGCGFLTIPALIKHNLDEQDYEIYTYTENKRRRDFTIMEEVNFISRLKQQGLSSVQISERTDNSETQVSNLLRIAKAPGYIQQACNDANLKDFTLMAELSRLSDLDSDVTKSIVNRLVTDPGSVSRGEVKDIKGRLKNPAPEPVIESNTAHDAAQDNVSVEDTSAEPLVKDEVTAPIQKATEQKLSHAKVSSVLDAVYKGQTVQIKLPMALQPESNLIQVILDSEETVVEWKDVAVIGSKANG